MDVDFRSTDGHGLEISVFTISKVMLELLCLGGLGVC